MTCDGATTDPDLLPLGEDADLSEWEVVEVGPALRPLGTTVCTRFEAGDARLMRRAARKMGLTQSEFVRRAVVRATMRTLRYSLKRERSGMAV